MKFLHKIIAGCAVLAVLVSCADYPQTEALLTQPNDLPRQSEVKNVRFVPHVDEQGAPGALAMALTWSGAPSQVSVLAPKLKGDGLQTEIVDEVTHSGRRAYPVTDLRGVLQELAAGHPVLVRQEPSGRPTPVWRYALVVGYDLDSKVLLVHSGRLENIKLPIQVFESNWQRADNWGVVVMAPNQPPASPTAVAAYRSMATAVAEAAPAKSQQTKVAAKTTPRTTAKTQVANNTATKPALKAAKPASKVADAGKGRERSAAKTSGKPAKQLATVPADKPAKPAKTEPDVPQTKGRQALLNPAGPGRLLVPAAYRH